jgi:hypothetical protein
MNQCKRIARRYKLRKRINAVLVNIPKAHTKKRASAFKQMEREFSGEREFIRHTQTTIKPYTVRAAVKPYGRSLHKRQF